MSEWISVEDMLPVYEDRYAILYRYKESARLIKFIGDFDPIDDRWRNTLDDIEILYWMPLHEIPKDIL